MPVEDTDLQIIEQVLAGDTDAFDSLVLKYQRQIGAVVVRMTGYHGDVADTIQKIFVKAFTKLPTFKQRSTFKTWLYAIAINTCRNDLRRIVKARREEELDARDFSVKPDVEQDILEEQRRGKLRSALKELPPKQMETVTLRIHQELSFKEIAEVLDTSENTAKVNFHHGMKRLSELVKD